MTFFSWDITQRGTLLLESSHLLPLVSRWVFLSAPTSRSFTTPSEGHPQSNPETSELMASNLWGAGKQDSPDFCVRRTNSRALWDGGPQLECQDLVTCGCSEAVFSCGFQILETTCYLGGTSFSRGLRGQGHERCGRLSASQKQRVEEHSPPTPPLSGPRRVRKT